MQRSAYNTKSLSVSAAPNMAKRPRQRRHQHSTNLHYSLLTSPLHWISSYNTSQATTHTCSPHFPHPSPPFPRYPLPTFSKSICVDSPCLASSKISYATVIDSRPLDALAISEAVMTPSLSASNTSKDVLTASLRRATLHHVHKEYSIHWQAIIPCTVVLGYATHL